MAYKIVTQKSTIGAATPDAFSALETLGEEMREWFDNMEGNNLGSTDKCSRVGETADALEGLSTVDVPETIEDMEMSYAEQVNKDKRRGASREVRNSNAVQMLEGAKDAAQNWLDDDENKEHADRSDVEEFINDLDNEIGNVDSLEFPGMYG